MSSSGQNSNDMPCGKTAMHGPRIYFLFRGLPPSWHVTLWICVIQIVLCAHCVWF